MPGGPIDPRSSPYLIAMAGCSRVVSTFPQYLHLEDDGDETDSCSGDVYEMSKKADALPEHQRDRKSPLTELTTNAHVAVFARVCNTLGTCTGVAVKNKCLQRLSNSYMYKNGVILVLSNTSPHVRIIDYKRVDARCTWGKRPIRQARKKSVRRSGSLICLGQTDDSRFGPRTNFEGDQVNVVSSSIRSFLSRNKSKVLKHQIRLMSRFERWARTLPGIGESDGSTSSRIFSPLEAKNCFQRTEESDLSLKLAAVRWGSWKSRRRKRWGSLSWSAASGPRTLLMSGFLLVMITFTGKAFAQEGVFRQAQPLVSSAPSLQTAVPTSTSTLRPTSTPTERPTASPTAKPSTHSPTAKPSISTRPTPSPTGFPTPSPSDAPSLSLMPTHFPTLSWSPSSPPSFAPSSSNAPSRYPSRRPTEYPTVSPSSHPSVMPSLKLEIKEETDLLQSFNGLGLQEMNVTQTQKFEELYQGYTRNFTGTDGSLVDTKCTVKLQTLVVESRRGLKSVKETGGLRRLQTTPEPTVSSIPTLSPLSPTPAPTPVSDIPGSDSEPPTAAPTPVRSYNLLLLYSMTWRSKYIDVTGQTVAANSFSEQFKKWMNEDSTLEEVATDLRGIGMEVDQVGEAKTVQMPQTPTRPPSKFPSHHPSTFRPSVAPVSAPPSLMPSAMPVTPEEETDNADLLIKVVAAAVGGVVILAALGLLICFKRRRAKSLQAAESSTPIESKELPPEENNEVVEEDSQSDSQQSDYNSTSHNSMLAQDNSMVHQQESLVSQESMVSAANLSGVESDSDLEVDHTHQIADEFDRYKNQKLEKMRAEVEGTVTDMDGMMSQAMTRALMDDDDPSRDMNGLMWGGDGDSMEIEASVLCETNDWLKRKEEASLEERQAFMQELLNKMVASVRFNIIAPEKASRAIHGAAAMLGLQLAGNLPETALVVTGMRKKVQKKDVVEAFEEFGEIDGAAVAPGARGFGLVRFRSPKSVQRAMEKFRTDEIVVQDVSVNVKVLSSSKVKKRQSDALKLPQQYPNDGMQGPYSNHRPAHNHLPGGIGYPEDSLGRVSEGGRRVPAPYPVAQRHPEGDAGSGAGSSGRHSRHQSGASSVTNHTDPNVPRRP